MLPKMEKTTSLDHIIRKIRKKLRQIENLERLNRTLSDEEIVKVQSKFKLRDELHTNLAALSQQEEAKMNEMDEPDDCSFESSVGQDEEASPVVDTSVPENFSSFLNQDDVSAERILPSLKPDAVAVTDSGVLPRAAGDYFDTKTEAQKVKVVETKKKAEIKTKKAKSTFSKLPCRVTCLDGHNDIITSLVVIGNKIITASRDTTLRCWDVITGNEEHIFGGHTETVTCVIGLHKSWTQAFDTPVPDTDHLIVSGSFDSSLKVWSVDSGHLVRSVYTFNPITCICYCPASSGVISGSDGGKLEFWDLVSGTALWSYIVYTSSVTGLKVSENTVFSSSADGVIKVHQISGQTLSCVFESENMKLSSGHPVSVRHVRCLEYGLQGLFYGDDSRNIKIVDWKKGIVSKVPNHSTNFTSIDALCYNDEYLLSSSYDLDTGLGYINVRSSQTLEYLGTVDDEDTERIVCLGSGIIPNGNTFVVSGGIELKLWEIGSKGSDWRSTNEIDDSDVITLHHKASLSRPAVDSDSDFSEEEEDFDDSHNDSGEDSGSQDEEEDSGSWMSWCVVL